VPPCPCPVCDRSLHARIRRPPSSTRFAYTTLFRSTNQTVCAGNIIQLNGAIGGAATSQTWYKNIVNPSSIVGTSLSEIYTPSPRSEEHTSELQSRENLVCRPLLEKKKKEEEVK